MLRRAGLVDHVDGAVGQLAVIDIAAGQFDRRPDRVVGIAQLVMLFEMRLQPHQDLDGVRHRGLVHVDLLEPARQRAVLLEMLAVFLVGGRTHAAQLAARQSRFQQIRGIHRPARGCAGADHRMNLVDEQDGVVVVFQFLDHGLQPFLEIAAIAGAGQQRAHIEREDRGAGQNLGRLALDDLLGQALGDGGLADARIAHQKRVVLAPPAQDLNATFDLGFAADQRIDVALLRFRVQIDAIFRQSRFVPGLLCLFGLLLLDRLVRACDLARFAERGVLGDPMGDEVDRVVTGHVHFLQEEGRVGFAFGEDRHQHIRTRDLLPARALDMNRGALDHALEGSGRHRLGTFDIGDQRREIILDEVDQQLAQFFQIDVAGPHDLDRLGFLGQRQQQMFQRCKFVAMFIGQREGLMNGLFQGGRETWHGRLLSVGWRYGRIERPTCPDCHDAVNFWWILRGIKRFFSNMPRFCLG